MISSLSFLFVCPYKYLKLLLSQKLRGKKNSGDYNVLLWYFLFVLVFCKAQPYISSHSPNVDTRLLQICLLK